MKYALNRDSKSVFEHMWQKQHVNLRADSNMQRETITLLEKIDDRSGDVESVSEYHYRTIRLQNFNQHNVINVIKIIIEVAARPRGCCLATD